MREPIETRISARILRVLAAVSRLFSDEHPIRAALADCLMVLFGNIVIWDTTLDIAGLSGPDLIDLSDPTLLEAVTLSAIMTFPFSAVAMMASHFIRLRSERPKRSRIWTALAMMASVPIVTFTTSAMLFQHISRDSLVVALFTFGLTGMPAAFRMTSPKAFVRPGRFVGNDGERHYGLHVYPID